MALFVMDERTDMISFWTRKRSHGIVIRIGAAMATTAIDMAIGGMMIVETAVEMTETTGIEATGTTVTSIATIVAGENETIVAQDQDQDLAARAEIATGNGIDDDALVARLARPRTCIYVQ